LEGQTSVKVIVHMLEFVSEGFIFFFLGAALWRSSNHWHPGLFFLTVFACIVGRGLAVYSLTWLANALWRKHAITNQECLMLWFSGLRGPVSFALAFRISENAIADELDRNTIITTTLLTIYITSFTMGGMSNEVLRWLHLIPGGNAEVTVVIAPAGGHGAPTREKTLMESNHWFKRLNAKFLEGPFGTASREFSLRHDLTMTRAVTEMPVNRVGRSVSVIKGGPMQAVRTNSTASDYTQPHLQEPVRIRTIELRKVDKHLPKPVRNESICE